LDLVYRIARDCCPGVTLAYNDFVVHELHARRVAKLRKVGCALALIQGHASEDGRIYGGVTATDLAPVAWIYRLNRMSVGFSELDVEQSQFSPCPAADVWRGMARAAQTERFWLFGLWGAADRHSWKRSLTPTPWGSGVDGDYMPKQPIIDGLLQGLG
jgi:GH35 family endo-1,4-beta-xylanase